MDLSRFFEQLESPVLSRWIELAQSEKPISGNVDLSRAKEIKVSKDTYFEAQSQGMSLSELLETEDYDPSDSNSPLDAFERQLAAHGMKVSGKNAITVELFYQGTPALLPGAA